MPSGIPAGSKAGFVIARAQKGQNIKKLAGYKNKNFRDGAWNPFEQRPDQ